MTELPTATEDDELAENTNDEPNEEDGPQDIPQEPILEDDVEA